jgi:hypothetical protein
MACALQIEDGPLSFLWMSLFLRGCCWQALRATKWHVKQDHRWQASWQLKTPVVSKCLEACYRNPDLVETKFLCWQLCT